MTTLIQQPRNTNGMFHPAARLQHSSHSMSSMGRRLFDAIRDSHMMQVSEDISVNIKSDMILANQTLPRRVQIKKIQILYKLPSEN